MKKLRTSKGDYCIKRLLSTITSLFKMGTSLKGKNSLPLFAPRGSEFFPLRAVPYGMENRLSVIFSYYIHELKINQCDTVIFGTHGA